MKRRVLAYYRWSTQKEQPIWIQQQKVRTFAKNNGWEIEEEFIDERVRGGPLWNERTSFKRMIEKIKDNAEGQFMIIVLIGNKLWRMSDSETKDVLSRNKVIVYSIY